MVDINNNPFIKLPSPTSSDGVGATDSQVPAAAEEEQQQSVFEVDVAKVNELRKNNGGELSNFDLLSMIKSDNQYSGVELNEDVINSQLSEIMGVLDSAYDENNEGANQNKNFFNNTQDNEKNDIGIPVNEMQNRQGIANNMQEDTENINPFDIDTEEMDFNG